MRFELTQSDDAEISAIARVNFENSLSQLIGHLPQDRLVTFAERFVEWHLNGKLPLDVRKLRTSIHWLQQQYTNHSKGPGQEQFGDEWAKLLQRLAVLSELLDEGSFLTRLQIATGHAFEFEWEPGEEGRTYGYQKRLRNLAIELANDFSLATVETWNVLKGAEAHHAGERRQNWQSRGNYKEPATPDLKNLPTLPEDWAWGTTEQIAAAIVDCPHSTPKWTTKGRICVRTTEFRPGLLHLSEVRFVSDQSFRERIARLEPQPGDILYSREGGILGIACRVPEDVSLCLGQRMMLIRPSRNVLSRFIMDWLNSPAILDRVKGLTSGSASPHLNVGEIRQFPIPVPPPNEQLRIVAEVERRLSVVEELESVVTANLQRATRLRQSILQKAFTGDF